MLGCTHCGRHYRKSCQVIQCWGEALNPSHIPLIGIGVAFGVVAVHSMVFWSEPEDSDSAWSPITMYFLTTLLVSTVLHTVNKLCWNVPYPDNALLQGSGLVVLLTFRLLVRTWLLSRARARLRDIRHRSTASHNLARVEH